jgi:hypothetical protein
MKPVAWAMFKDNTFMDAIHPDEHTRFEGGYTIPLYTHPAKTPTLVLDGNRVYSTAKTLTDEEILKIHAENPFKDGYLNNNLIEFARAILRKAQGEG